MSDLDNSDDCFRDIDDHSYEETEENLKAYKRIKCEDSTPTYIKDLSISNELQEGSEGIVGEQE